MKISVPQRAQVPATTSDGTKRFVQRGEMAAKLVSITHEDDAVAEEP